MTDTQANDADNLRRPASLSAASSQGTLWSSGSYRYDGAGNVVKTGNSYFLYDRVSRLVDGHVYDNPLGAGNLRSQTYTYDPYGNLTAIGGDAWAPGRSTPTATTTNRLTAGTFDAAGNMTAWSGNSYEYDGLGMMKRMVAGAEDWRYIYTADDERFWAYRAAGSGPGSIWTLRDLDGKVLRQYDAHISWTQVRDYVYRDGQLLASNYPGEGDRHFSLDHLGTLRLVTASASSGSFYTLTPCRVLDTRSPPAPLTAGGTRTVQMAGACGIPGTATAVSVNITVVDASTQGEMTAYPANTARPLASAISYRPGLARANNAVLKLGNGALNFYCNQPSGTANLIIDVNGYFVEGAGSVVAYHAYFPFGEEITSATQDVERRKFTGHERDFADPASVADDLDYMHARFHNPLIGRFQKIDPLLDKGILTIPQAWNRYTYVRNRPLALVDPTGKYVCNGSVADCRVIRRAVRNLARAASRLPEDSEGRSRLQKVVDFYGKYGERNGVTVVVGSGTLPGASGGTRTRDSRTTIGVQLESLAASLGGRTNSKFGPEVAATLAHEGQHGLDQRTNGMPSNKDDVFQGEVRAFATEAFADQGLGSDSPFGIWTQADGVNEFAIQWWATQATNTWCAVAGCS